LTRLRGHLAWYPDDVWLWMTACQWRRVAQEEAFVGRAAEVGDELGAQVVAGRLARELMRLWFLFQRRYWPYAKWLGTAFGRLSGTDETGAALQAAMAATSPAEREAALITACELTARAHNDTRLTDPVEPIARSYHGRPYAVIMADRFVDACRARFTAATAALPLIGTVDQWADSTDVLSDPARTRSAATAVYEG
jgi:hypothetical protein